MTILVRARGESGRSCAARPQQAGTTPKRGGVCRGGRTPRSPMPQRATGGGAGWCERPGDIHPAMHNGAALGPTRRVGRTTRRGPAGSRPQCGRVRPPRRRLQGRCEESSTEPTRAVQRPGRGLAVPQVCPVRTTRGSQTAPRHRGPHRPHRGAGLRSPTAGSGRVPRPHVHRRG